MSSQHASENSQQHESRVLLNYVLAHAREDQRPYVEVTIYGKPILSLLDSGSTRTILGLHGWQCLRSVCHLDSRSKTDCIVADGSRCESIGFVTLPICLRDRVILLEVLVVPSLPHGLILGIDFWTKMQIVPDLFSGEWSFRTDKGASLVSAIQDVGTLTDDQRRTLQEVVDTAFTEMGDRLGCTTLVELEIKTDSSPIKQRYYPISPALQKEVNCELEKMLADGIIERSSSPWSSPIVMIKKKSGGWRFCVDYRVLNKATIKDSYPLPYVNTTLDKLRDARYLTTLDIKSAYWQIPIAESSRPLTAFTVPSRGLFQFKRMPFGLTNAPAVWQRLIDRVVGIDLEQYVFVYLDDVIICTSTFDKHLEVLKEVLTRIQRAGLTLNKEKCQFCKPQLKYLGYIVNACGLLVDPEKVEAIVRIPPPKNVSEIRRIVGMASWYRRFVPNFSTVIAPLANLTRKNVKFVWSEECQQAFDSIKGHLVEAPILSCPDFSLPFTIQCDASDYGLGAVLSQVHNGEEHVISYLSRSLNKNERRYTTTEKECLAVLFAIEKLRPYIEGTRFTVVTDHYSLKWLNSIKDPVGRIARWAVRLQQYDFDIVHRKGKDHIVPDALSRAVPIVDKIDSVLNGADSNFEVTDSWYASMRQRVSSQSSKFPLWRLEDGKLFKKCKPSLTTSLDPSTSWMLVPPRNQRTKIIRENHDPPTCGHLGIFKTASRIAQRYYWPNMKQDVARFVGRCHTCLKTKPTQRSPCGLMLSQQPTCVRPWQIVSVDLVGPLPRSSSGYSYILSVYDLFSKFVLFFPLRKATANGVVRWLEDHVILVFGAPSKLIADNGPQFRSKLFKDLAERYGILIRYTANYHPQANPVERTHRVLKSMLSSYVEDKHKTWDQFLAKAGYAMRSSTHEVTQYTPNFVMFGRELRVVASADRQVDGLDSFDAVARADVLQQIFGDIQRRLKKAYESSRHRYNLRRRDDAYRLHQQVWRKNYVLSNAANQFTAKLAPKFVGPFQISKVVSPWTYELSDSAGCRQGVWHAKDLKSHPPDHQTLGK